jgi:hypothetical protein
VPKNYWDGATDGGFDFVRQFPNIGRLAGDLYSSVQLQMTNVMDHVILRGN